MFEITIHREALAEIKAMPEMLRAKLARQIDKLAARGTDLREPDTKPLGSGFFELRAKANEIGRAVYVYQKGRRIFILKAFVKETKKTPAAVMIAAAHRLEEMLNDE
ncbi:type II toxin-antitoxin system RelE/ParE family toxin [Pantoea sp. R13S299]|uniref:type II toxin-antitoxin system RelE/ParE family toxin n=1 Tax=Pantoea TaxID=53335 RepID=UPI003ADCE86F